MYPSEMSCLALHPTSISLMTQGPPSHCVLSGSFGLQGLRPDSLHSWPRSVSIKSVLDSWAPCSSDNQTDQYQSLESWQVRGLGLPPGLVLGFLFKGPTEKGRAAALDLAFWQGDPKFHA